MTQKALSQTKILCMFYQSFSKKTNLVFVFLLLLLLFNSVGVNAQKCNYEKNEVDALTELTIKRTEPEFLCRISGQPLYAKAQCIGKNKYLKLVFYRFNDFMFDEDREVSFILSNHDELIVYPRAMPVDSAKMDDLTNVNSLLIYKLTEEQYKTLTVYPVTKFRYFVSTGFVEVPITSKRQHAVIDVLKCVE